LGSTILYAPDGLARCPGFFYATSPPHPTARLDLSERAFLLTAPFQATVHLALTTKEGAMREQINADLKEAMKAGDKRRVTTALPPKPDIGTKSLDSVPTRGGGPDFCF